MLFMLFDSVRIDEYIVQVHVHEAADGIAKYRCHHALESCRGVTVALLHDMTDERACDCRKRGLVDILSAYTHLFVCIG